MSGAFPELAEIARRRDDSASEMIHPDAIDEHSCRQRIVLARNRIRQFYSAASGDKGLSLSMRENREKPSWRHLAFVIAIATNMDVTLFDLLLCRR